MVQFNNKEMKKEFITSNGSKGMTIDCVNYEVEIFKSVNHDYYTSCIKYTEKKSGKYKIISAAFKIDWDEEKAGGKLELKYRDRWGSEMNFIHNAPSDLKGIFDFIGKGYDVFTDGFGTCH